MTSQVTLHHLECSRSIRVLWLLEYLQVDYNLRLYPRDETTKLATSAPFSGQGLAAIHPTGRSPLLEDGEISLAETTNIFRHLLEHHSSSSPQQNKFPKPSERSQKASDLNFWIEFSEGSMMLHIIPLFYMMRGGNVTEDGNSMQEKVVVRGIKNDFDYYELALEKNGGTLNGNNELGPADFANQYPLELASRAISCRPPTWRKNLKVDIGPRTRVWLDRCRSDPTYQKICLLERDGKVPAEHFLDLFFPPSAKQ